MALRRWLIATALIGAPIAVVLPSIEASAEVTAMTSVAPSPAPLRVDTYVLSTNVAGNAPASPPNDADVRAVRKMIHSQLAPRYDAQVGTKPGPDFLSIGNYPPKSGAYVAIATVCKTAQVYSISINGYALGSQTIDPSSGSLTGTFDALESGDWSNLFGTGLMFSFASFLPVSNDANGIVNPRLLRNLPITLIATPAPAPIAPPPPGQPPPPAPPATRIKECQASAYQMLIIGRTVITSTNNDISRAIVAGSALQFRQPGWGSYYQALGAAGALFYSPASADVSVDFFICPPRDVTVFADEAKQIKLREYKAGKLYQIGGTDAHITGHHVTPAIGVNPYANQRALDLATVDLANQLDCIIYRELAELQVDDFVVKQKAIYGDDDLGATLWCANYFTTLKFFEGKIPKPVTRPAKLEESSPQSPSTPSPPR